MGRCRPPRPVTRRPGPADLRGSPGPLHRRPSPHASLAHMCTGIREIGQLGATNRTNGTPQRAPWVVGFHRGDTGHFLQLRRPANRTGAETVTIGPTTAHRLRRQLNGLHDHVRSAT
ncbi:MAG TPA: ESX secretion-associated protein EspG [Pseudonocardiaceae bacterium]